MIVSVFKSANEPAVLTNLPFESVLCGILHSSKLQNAIAAVRAGKLDKKKLPAFSPSCTFKETRNEKNIDQYTGIVHVDIDGLNFATLPETRDKLRNDAHVFAFFVSPSGKGLKVFFRVTSTLEDHRKMIAQLANDLKENFGIEADRKVHDPARLCFLSFDPDLYHNPNALPVDLKEITQPVSAVSSEESDAGECLVPDEAIEFLERITNNHPYWKSHGIEPGYYAGNRNQYVYLLLCNCNRYGVSLEEATSLAFSRYWFRDHSGMQYHEFTATIKSAYSNTHEHGKFQLPVKLFQE